MINFLMFGGIIFLFLCFPVSIIFTIVFAVKKKKILVPAICIPICFALGISFIVSGGIMYGQTDEYKQSIAEKEKNEELKEQEK